MRPRRTASTSSTSHAGEPGFGCSASIADSLHAVQASLHGNAVQSAKEDPVLRGFLSNHRPEKGDASNPGIL